MSSLGRTARNGGRNSRLATAGPRRGRWQGLPLTFLGWWPAMDGLGAAASLAGGTARPGGPATGRQLAPGLGAWSCGSSEVPRSRAVHHGVSGVRTPENADVHGARARAQRKGARFYLVQPFLKMWISKILNRTWKSPKIKVVEEL
jgi:hypothetical protein